MVSKELLNKTEENKEKEEEEVEKENEKWGQTMHEATMSRTYEKTKAVPLGRSQMHGIENSWGYLP